jgi:hypothetical protein
MSSFLASDNGERENIYQLPGAREMVDINRMQVTKYVSRILSNVHHNRKLRIKSASF